MATTSPGQAGSDTNWIAIGATYHASVALKGDGTLWAWGSGYNGETGNGLRTSTNSPARVAIDSDWKAIAAGSLHVLALKNDGTLWAWGDNSFGQAGQPVVSSPATVMGNGWGMPTP